MELLKERAKEMVSSISGVLKTVQALDNPQHRATRALEATSTAIDAHLRYTCQDESFRFQPCPHASFTLALTSYHLFLAHLCILQ